MPRPPAVLVSILCVALAAGAIPHRASHADGPPPHSSGASVAQADAVLTGEVRDAATGAAVRDAVVSADEQQRAARTDSAGRFTLLVERPADGRVALRVRRIGYEPLTRRVRLERGDTTAVRLALRPSVSRLSEVVVAEQDAAGKTRRALERRAAVEPGTAPVLAPSPQPAAHRAMDATAFATTPPPPVPADAAGHLRARTGPWNTEEYGRIEDNPFVAVGADPLSTFSIDVDRASYGNVRRFLLQERRLPPKDAVRIEELVNYFAYENPEPRGGDPVAITSEVAAAPWAPAHRLVRVALQAPRLALDELPPSDLVFLIDVSGSMQPENKLPLLKQSLRLLVHELRPEDRVALVVYAGAAGLVLPPTPASERETILDAIERLEAGGSTAGGAGIQLAYDVARRAARRGGNTRVVLATDGDFNVGVSSTAELVRLVERRREEGTALTVLGFGMGNYKDARLEQLADRGNGNYAYIDDLHEARKVLVREVGGTLHTVAKNVKLQLEFDPRAVQAFRLIGYENRMLAHEDFEDDAKDAGELGAGHAVTALYEVVPVGVELDVPLRGRPPLRYQEPPRTARRAAAGDELLTVSLRYVRPGETRSRLLEHAVRDRARSGARPSDGFRFAAAVAGFGMLLRESPHRGGASWPMVESLARGAVGADPDGDRAGFLELVRAAARLSEAVARSGDGEPHEREPR